MSFASELSNFTAKAESNTEQVFRASTISLFSRIISRTPVKSGRLKGNWQIDINQPATGDVSDSDTTPINTLDGGSKRKVASGVMRANLNDSIYMVNNLPYARRIENGNFSDQAPAGMVGVSVAEFNREVEKQARKLK
jgi:hypothetical protein